ncbi:MAG: hypothetical protein AB1403_21305, partial [Candidatus Riflebacteria bacterium]
RISKNTQRQLERCRQIQDEKLKKVEPIKKPEDESSNFEKKILVAILSLGTLLGGAVYQYAQEVTTKKTTSAIILPQGAK